MRISFGKRIGGAYVGASTSTKKIAGGVWKFFLFPLYLIYYVCIWPFVAIGRLCMGKSKKSMPVTKMEAEQKLRIMNDCQRILNETKNPQTFFERYDLFLDCLVFLASAEGKIKMTGDKPSEALRQARENKTAKINSFLDRYAQDVKFKIFELSTPKAKLNKADAFKNTLCEFYDRMNAENVLHCTELYEDLKLAANK